MKTSSKKPEILDTGNKVEEIYNHFLVYENSGFLHNWESDILEFLQSWYNDSETITVQTSGSTGKPKEIRLMKSWMKYSALQTCSFFELNNKSTVHLCLPVKFIAGKMMLVRALTANCKVVLTPPEANPFLKLNCSIDFTAITPYQLYKSFSTLQNKRGIKNIIVGGAAIDSELEKMVQILPQNIYSTYGMTETSTHVALRRINKPDRKDYFTIIGHTQIMVDEHNCLELENAELFDERIVTNDIVEIIDNRSFRWLGRLDNVINSGGIKLIVERLENAISHLRKEKMFIVGLTDKVLGQAAYLIIEGPEICDDEKYKLLSDIKKLLTRHECPKDVICLENIPFGQNGKVERVRLKQLAEGIVNG